MTTTMHKFNFIESTLHDVFVYKAGAFTYSMIFKKVLFDDFYSMLLSSLKYLKVKEISKICKHFENYFSKVNFHKVVRVHSKIQKFSPHFLPSL